MIRIQDFHNDHLMLRRAISFACGDELVLQLATFAYWVTKVTLTLTFNIKMWASTETSLIISFHLIVTTSKTSTQIYNKCKH